MIRRLAPGDEELLRRLAGRFKEHVPEPAAAAAFLADEGHYVFAAVEEGDVAGFAYDVRRNWSSCQDGTGASSSSARPPAGSR